MQYYEIIEHKNALFANAIFKKVNLTPYTLDKKGLYDSYHILSSKEENIKDDISPDIFKDLLLNHLKDILVFENYQESLSEAIPNLCAFESSVSGLLLNLIKYVPYAYFDKTLQAFEEIVNTEGIYGDTDFYRSILLKQMGCFDLKDKKEKILAICSSKILNKKNNKCDILTESVGGMQNRNPKDLYECLLVVAWNIMSVFHDNPIIVQNCYPDNMSGYISAYNIANGYLHLRATQKIDLTKINENLFIQKFPLTLLNNIQQHFDKGKLKKDLSGILFKNSSEQEQKLLILQPLMSLNMSAFKEMNKLYPHLIDTICYEDIQEISISNMDYHNLIKAEKDVKLKKLIEKYNFLKIKDEEAWRDNVKENVWKFIYQNRIKEEKETLRENTQLKSIKKKHLKSEERL